MKSKKSLLLFPVMAGLVMVGCATSSNSSSPASSSSATSTSSQSSSSSSAATDYIIKDKTSITFWNNSSYGDQIESIIEAFKAVEPNVTVTNVKQTGSYNDVKDMVVQGIPANNYPDLFLGYPDSVCEIMNYNKVVKLDPYMDNASYGWTAAEKADIVSSYLEEGQSYPVEGTWSLPIAKSTEAMFYNADVLIGLDLKAQDATINSGKALTADYLNNLTWEEMFNHLCPAITAYNATLADKDKILKTDQTYHGIISYDSDDNLFITLAEQYGYGYTSVNQTTGVGSLDFNNDNMKGLMKTFNKAAQDGYFLTKGFAGGNYTNTYFTKGNLLFSIGSTGGTKYQLSSDFNVGVAKIPHAAGKDAKVINQGPSVCILDHGDSNRALATWLFYKYFTNQKNNTAWSINTSYSPIRYSVYETDEYADASSESGKVAKSLELLQAKVNNYVGNVNNQLFLSPVFKGSSDARTQVGSLMTLCLQQTAISDTWLKTAFQTAIDNTKLKM
jgi:multiple sugar transport system substrate-binding protein